MSADLIEAQAAEIAALREACEAARWQFAFYADEHRKANKTEKAATNQRFADMLAGALTQHQEPK